MLLGLERPDSFLGASFWPRYMNYWGHIVGHLGLAFLFQSLSPWIIHSFRFASTLSWVLGWMWMTWLWHASAGFEYTVFIRSQLERPDWPDWPDLELRRRMVCLQPVCPPPLPVGGASRTSSIGGDGNNRNDEKENRQNDSTRLDAHCSLISRLFINCQLIIIILILFFGTFCWNLSQLFFYQIQVWGLI